MQKKISVGILGATGSVGQRFVQLLADHPWFEVAALTGSDKKMGRTYGEACHWVLSEPMPEWAKRMSLQPSDPDALGVPVVFSSLPSGAAKETEAQFARAGAMVFSNASAYRGDADVPILLPEVNPDHVAIVSEQRKRRGWAGCIITNANCTSTGMTIALKALQEAFGLSKVFAVSMQALSGAGYPGVASLDIVDNLLPWIEGEEEKVEWEPRKILGQVKNGMLEEADVVISAHTNRVPVTDGHTVCLSVETRTKPRLEEAAQVLRGYTAPDVSHDLPSTPKPVIVLKEEEDRPQPRLDRMEGGGMTTIIGRLRADPIFDLRMVVLSHNTIRGAAGGSIYNAELLVKIGLVG